MATISIEREERVIRFSSSVSIKEVLELNEFQIPQLLDKRYGVIITSYINGSYYRIVSSEYFRTLGRARQVMSDQLEAWAPDTNSIIKDHH